MLQLQSVCKSILPRKLTCMQPFSSVNFSNDYLQISAKSKLLFLMSVPNPSAKYVCRFVTKESLSKAEGDLNFLGVSHVKGPPCAEHGEGGNTFPSLCHLVCVYERRRTLRSRQVCCVRRWAFDQRSIIMVSLINVCHCRKSDRTLFSRAGWSTCI